MDTHIEIEKESYDQLKYKFQHAFPNDNENLVNRSSHGQQLNLNISSVSNFLTKNRQNAGLNSNELLAVKLTGNVSSTSIDNLSAKLNSRIVEETQLDKDSVKLVMQFNNKSDLKSFGEECSSYALDRKEKSLFTCKQRDEICSSIQTVSSISPEERTGSRLQKMIDDNEFPDNPFVVDVDLFFDGDIRNRTKLEKMLQDALGTGNSHLLGDLFVLPKSLLGRALVNRFTLNALRNLDIIEKIELPLGIIQNNYSYLYDPNFQPTIVKPSLELKPLACILDSGINDTNPFLKSLVIGKKDFDKVEKTELDLNGHGTGVAGIVAYGNFNDPEGKFTPYVRLCNAKITHNIVFGSMSGTGFLDRPEKVVSDAIRYFNKNYGCRIFNLSVGDPDSVYNGGKQTPWAAMLDSIVLELDVVIVISAGNMSDPDIPEFSDREDLMKKVCGQLLLDKQRILSPATSSLSVTVGSITRNGEPYTESRRPNKISCGKENSPSVFTRTGLGVFKCIKPDFTDYGGNYAVYQQTSSANSWDTGNKNLLEPTLNKGADKYFVKEAGTSFSAPHVTHIAARLESSLFTQLKQKPSANLIKAMLASSSEVYNYKWLTETASLYKDNKLSKSKNIPRMRLVGYGKVNDNILFPGDNHVTLFAEDRLILREVHLYKIPVPKDFLDLKANKKISIGFAYNPPVFPNRKQYLGNQLWFEVFRKVEDVDELINTICKVEDLDNVTHEKKEFVADFSPCCEDVKFSTLQQRVWSKTSRGGQNLAYGDDNYLYVAVTGKEVFKHEPNDEQDYAIAITFSYDSNENISLRQNIFEKVKLRQRERIPIRTQIKS